MTIVLKVAGGEVRLRQLRGEWRVAVHLDQPDPIREMELMAQVARLIRDGIQ